MPFQRWTLAVGLWICWLAPVLAGTEVDPDTFASLLAQIKPQPGESRWLEETPALFRFEPHQPADLRVQLLRRRQRFGECAG